MSQADSKWTCPTCGATFESSITSCPYCTLQPAQAEQPEPGQGVSYVPPETLYAPLPPPKKKRSAIMPIIVIVVVFVVFFALAYEGVFVVDGITKELEYGDGAYIYEWNFDGRDYSMSMDISSSSFDYYDGQSVARGFTVDGYGNIDYDHVRDFITETDATVMTTVANLKQLASMADLSEFETLELALAFVQSFPYTFDSDYYGIEDYWAFPVETLVHYTGDCEDTAFLYASIVEGLGTDAAIIVFEDHIAVGVAHEDATGTYYQPDNVRYYYCETTGTGWAIGELPEGRDTAHVVDV
ncbi:MAG: hypothetical protein LLG16_04550 [Euryarchaeota archaeon]|nr:hypothetical protein [Euryarchaeota archaeon]